MNTNSKEKKVYKLLLQFQTKCKRIDRKRKTGISRRKLYVKKIMSVFGKHKE